MRLLLTIVAAACATALQSCTFLRLVESTDDNQKWGFIDRAGAWVIPPRFDSVSINYQMNLGDKVDLNAPIAVSIKQKWGYINRKGDFVIEPQFDQAGDFSNGLALVELKDRAFYIDETGKTRFSSNGDRCGAGDFQEGLASFAAKNGKEGFIDTHKQFVIPPRFEDCRQFSEGLAFVTARSADGKKLAQYIDKTGKVRIQIPSSGRAEVCGNPFRDGLAIIFWSQHGPESGGPTGYDLFNSSGAQVPFPANCEFADGNTILEGMVPIKSGRKFGFMNASGKITAPLRFTNVGSFGDGMAPASESNVIGLPVYGYIGSNGKWNIEPQFGEAQSFSEGLAAVSKLFLSNGKYGYIDTKGKEIIEPRFDWPGPFRGGLAAVGVKTEERR